ncbi:putative extracellular nuclease [Friedmanniella endophytica]|uniref:Putative extracellular nuclease n=1 Tax=Microlunatus kandeliicorticis TaxID=1759536 RepID=A0A7W3P548_9ACTN|nr:ExeM/NucH family extracellular endonuclease [Microlunatus kandeliicorticis]MBA8793482.1 putative extracellular nuclease [Microlunatus kandeliicorticis]
MSRRSPRALPIVLSATLVAGSGLAATAVPAHAADPVTIAEVQGTGATSPLLGRQVALRPSVVTAVYGNGSADLRGFVVQTPGTGGPRRDLDRPSDAVFVYTGGKPAGVAIGDLVDVSGTVQEYGSAKGNTLTEIGGAVTVSVSRAPHAAVRPITGLSWAATAAHRENLESMLWQAPKTFTISDVYPVLHYGELALSEGRGVAVQPTDAAPYGSTREKAQAARNAARGVLLDDGTNAGFFATASNPAGGTPPYLTRNRDVKVGDTARITRPVIIDVRFGDWTLQPTTPTPAGHEIARITVRPREKVPTVRGRLSIASFNVENFFPTVGQGRTGCTGSNLDTAGSYNVTEDCDVRGAWDRVDFGRQQAKIVAAVNTLSPAVAGLMEIENSIKVGAPRDSALRTLVTALNRAAGYRKWAFVPSSTQLQPTSDQDVITSALIYQPARAKLVGHAYADGADAVDSGPFGNARTPIGAVFTPRSGGARALVVVNHFKSKGSAPSDADDPNADHGQGAWNADRVAQAEALASWVPSVQQASGARAVALIGDFNSYTHEDPLRTLEARGYVNAAPESDHSYVYDGLSGSLDHVLLNRTAARELTGAHVWNINSITSDARDYSEYDTTAVDYYHPNPYRASDHDPVIVGLAVPRG